jgi:hypothetical protein
MKTFKIIFADDSELQIEAHHFVMDGSGLRLIDGDGDMIAAWVDGQVKAIWPLPATE